MTRRLRPTRGSQSGPAASAHGAALFPLGILPVRGPLAYGIVLPLCRSPFSSATAFSKSSRSSGSTTMPAAW